MTQKGIEATLPVKSLVPGDVVYVDVGRRFPADGIVLEGASSTDESLFGSTADSVGKSPGAMVFAGTMNLSAPVRVRATRTGANTSLGRMISLAEKAAATSLGMQQAADRAIRYVLPTALLLVALAFLGWWLAGDVPRGALAFIAVLIVAAPCTLALAPRATVLVGLSTGTKASIFLHGDNVLQRAEALTTVVVDKTSALTRGRPVLTDIVTFGDTTAYEILQLTAAVEADFNHPVGAAIVLAARQRRISLPTVSNSCAIPRYGVRGIVAGCHITIGCMRLARREGVATARAARTLRRIESQAKTAVLVVRDGVLAGVIAVADYVKSEAGVAIAALRRERVEVIILRGDAARSAHALGARLGIRNVIADIPRDARADVIRALRKRGRVVAVVGDATNGDPMLAAADFGIPIGSGPDLRAESGDIALIRDDVRDVAAAIRLCRAIVNKIAQSRHWTFLYASIGVPAAALGLLSPSFAAGAAMLGGLSIVANGALIKVRTLKAA